MVALLDHINTPSPRPGGRRLRLVPPSLPGGADSPTSRDPLAHQRRPSGVDSARPSLSAAVDRRATAVVAAVLLVLASLMVLQVGPPAPGERAETALVSAPPEVGESVVRVEPGDTIWGIAETLADGSDVRPIVAALVARNGGETIRPGQLVVIPAELG